MKMKALTTKLRVEIENEMRVLLESVDLKIQIRVSHKSGLRMKFRTITFGHSAVIEQLCFSSSIRLTARLHHANFITLLNRDPLFYSNNFEAVPSNLMLE